MPFRDTVLPLISSKTLGQVLLMALAVGAYSLLPMWKEYSAYRDIGDVPSEIHAALSLVLGWLLVFRTNAAYSRWWEARTLWGSLINASRNLSIKLVEYGRPESSDARQLSALVAAFPKELKDQLRGVAAPAPLATTTQPSNTDRHQPVHTAKELFRWLSQRAREGKLADGELRVIDTELSKLLEICGACERIAKTPFVPSYRIFLRQCILLLLLTFPWGISTDFGWWSIPITIFVAYFMIGMEVVAEHVEEPFGYDEDDLDLDGMCTTIQRSVEQIFAINTIETKDHGHHLSV